MDDRLIVALDVETVAAATELMDRIGPGLVGWYKVGLELYAAAGPAAVRAVRDRGARVMLDLKLHDIPETVARATARAADLGVELLTIHTAGGRRMMESAQHHAGAVKLLGVTVLTSMDDRDLAETCVEGTTEEVVVRRATLAMEAGLAGVVASPHEAARLRAGVPSGFLIVTPGVRPVAAADDQKRVATPRAAITAGASKIVVGRPVRDAADPRAAVQQLLADLA
jgi:orotidine-5'-phosphate decarboxylase